MLNKVLILIILTCFAAFNFAYADSYSRKYTESNDFDRPTLEYMEDQASYQKRLKEWKRKQHKTKVQELKRTREADRKANQQLIEKRVKAREERQRRMQALEREEGLRQKSGRSRQRKKETKVVEKEQPASQDPTSANNNSLERENTQKVQEMPRKKRSFMQKLRDSLF